MSKSSKPHKTLAKRYYNVARALLRDLVVVFVAGKNDSKVQVWNRKRGKIEFIGKPTALAISDTPMPWSVLCAVTCRRQDGQQYMRTEELAAPHPITQAQIAKHCNELHMQLLKACNPMHRLTAAWIAVPTGEELPMEEVDRIITVLGAYEFLAQWEADEVAA
ncbi:hypothetical protein [Shewanella fodinae]|uniref:hypothetical protein n=1 Tax=Shewanella fodinae TaxID=552357 RepID=UPI0016766C94|nr:hypothetical protein [Shewanella fodinae]MCL2905208.1 hypothetical protein [Shewanella fodinae]GGY87771.1 hypothetical protein GCM10007169_01170 [Shewanella fodinae]